MLNFGFHSQTFLFPVREDTNRGGRGDCRDNIDHQHLFQFTRDDMQLLLPNPFNNNNHLNATIS